MKRNRVIGLILALMACVAALALVVFYRQSQPQTPVYPPYNIDFYSRSGSSQAQNGRSVPRNDWRIEPEKHSEND